MFGLFKRYRQSDSNKRCWYHQSEIIVSPERSVGIDMATLLGQLVSHERYQLWKTCFIYLCPHDVQSDSGGQMVVTQVVIRWSHENGVVQEVGNLTKKKQVGQSFQIIQPAVAFGRGGRI